ncbi:hypothetical protein ACFVWG_27810 [Kribbella sp. NPDC058245]|uniref:hypothetical protein n=1 Tax=Kribbella sp. NPDC058245 TaxID=3346399 RepID=UPI0036E8D60B
MLEEFMSVGESANMASLLAPAQAGVVREGSPVFHTGLWLSPNRTLLFIGVVVEGEAPSAQRPSITIDGSQGLTINNFSYVMGSGPRGGYTWLLQADIDHDRVPLLSGGTLTMRYGNAEFEYTAPLALLP